MSSRTIGLTLAVASLLCAQCGADGGATCRALPPVGSCLDAAQARACTCDEDCACGTNIATNDCDYGRAECIDGTVKCPDFCNGIAANLVIRCVAGVCDQLVR